MTTQVYYRAGTSKSRGVVVPLADALNQDDVAGGLRQQFKDRVRQDQLFLRHSLGCKEGDAKTYIEAYENRWAWSFHRSDRIDA